MEYDIKKAYWPMRFEFQPSSGSKEQKSLLFVCLTIYRMPSINHVYPTHPSLKNFNLFLKTLPHNEKQLNAKMFPLMLKGKLRCVPFLSKISNNFHRYKNMQLNNKKKHLCHKLCKEINAT